MADISGRKAVWEIQRRAATAKYRLTGSAGLCASSSTYTLYKYAVTAGDVLYLSLSAITISDVAQPVYQWQTSVDVPTSGTNTYLVGTPVTGAVNSFVEVPSTATFLIISQLTATTAFKVCETVPVTDDISKITLPSTDAYDVKDKLGRQLIPFGTTDFDSTSTAFKATIEGITELRSGVMCYITNTKIKSASGCTINVNGLGAKPIYSTTAVNTRITTEFNVNVTWLLIYNESRVSGGCWDMVYTYNTNTNTTTIQDLYTGAIYPKAGTNGVHQYNLFMVDSSGLIQGLVLQDGTSSHTKNTVGFRLPNVYYYNGSAAIAAGANSTSSYYYISYDIDLRYSTNCGTTLTAGGYVYLVGTVTNGLFYLDDTWWTQTLPTTDDGKVYVYIGFAISTSKIHLSATHPIYWYKDGAVRNYASDIVTQSAAGLMSATDKTKLDSVESYWHYNSTTDSIDLIFPST